MKKTRLGKTGLMVTRTSFGVLPVQRTEKKEAARILRRAFDGGMNFYDSARAYTDSEEKLGYALGSVRDQIHIATKSGATTRAGLLKDLETSLRNLGTDYVDLMQLHNPKDLPNPEDPESSYAGLLEARRKGMIRHLGITQHSIAQAEKAVASGLYETMQFPLCMISSGRDMALAELCRKNDMGVIAMKALCGGLLRSPRAAFVFLRQHENIVPIWGIQRMDELEKLLALDAEDPRLDAELQDQIARDRAELSGSFCRACGYCLPCPAKIPIPMAARMHLLLQRMPTEAFRSDEWRKNMSRIGDCTECGHCRKHCPYGLNPPVLLKEAKAAYDKFIAAG
jgi:aryl-alcohol dehydrogenase-like predicted oxidoreductase